MNTTVSGPSASIIEIFKSRQGEGPCVGEEQLFVRFGGCNLVCDYCDTPASIPARSGKKYLLDELVSAIDRFRSSLRRPVVSLTGGEPLTQVAFLEKLIPILRERGWKIYLETNGALPGALQKVVDSCDWIAMDYKFETAIQRDLWEAHQWFLQIGGKKTFVKLVLTDKTSEAEFQRAVNLVASVQPGIPVILQPATPHGLAKSLPLEALGSWWGWAATRLRDVRVIPQIHPLWGIA